MPTTKRQLQYVVAPHPDDELSAWSVVEGSEENYPVFVVLTHGEATAMADGHGLETAKGERTPQPQPFHGPHSLFLRAQRLDSWHAFLDGMAAVDSTLDIPPFHAHLQAAAAAPGGRDSGLDVFIGDATARVVFNLGDGTLAADAVEWAVRTARNEVRPLLPVQQEYGVVGAAYYNASYPGPTYTHPDHRAVHIALWDVDLGLPGPQWGRTTHSDPDVAATNGRTDAISTAGYDAAMALGPSGERIGRFQQAYGWLAFDPSGAFPPAPAPGDDGAVSRYQSFWRRF